MFAPQPVAGQEVFHGRRGQLSATIPRLEGEAVIDGQLDEAVWRQAAVLTGFSNYLPFDNRPAPDSTEVFLWYTETAIYAAIRAYESHGPVHATLAARDRIDGDDYIQLLIDPFNDRRRAFVFGVNPLGAQADGMRTDGSNPPQARGQTFGGNPPANIDLNPDFVFESRGHLTDYGYEVELRIPLKSIRFQGTAEERWSFQVLRYVQHSGYQQTWTPARRGSAAFISQSGTLTGFRHLRRDQVVELNPEFTASRNGTRSGDEWRRETAPAIGGNLRWRLAPNMTVNATARPDFSQVEADAAQIPGDTRFSLFFPEKRPFFVDGIEQFDTPNNLIYTRRIVQPDAALKYSARLGRTTVALLSALDDQAASLSGRDRPLHNLLRVRQDILTASTMGFTLTDRQEGDRYNRVVSADTRIIFQREYGFNAAAAVSTTRTDSGTVTAPQFDISVMRTGLRQGFYYGLSAVAPDFSAASGFVPRSDFVRTFLSHRVSFYGTPGSFVESYLVRGMTEGLWLYDGFRPGDGAQESKVQLENVLNLRGGWIVSVTPVSERFRFDPRAYARYGVLHATPAPGAPADTLSFTPSASTSTLQALVRVTTPQYRLFSGRFGAIVGRDVDFFETAASHRTDLTADIDFRPSSQLRLTTSYLYSTITRWRDNTTFSRASVPRLKVEYQISRPLYLRFVGQYDSRTRDALRDPRTNAPILLRQGDAWARADRLGTRDFRVDWLLSYIPSPGTVLFAGYGASLTEDEAFRFRHFERVRDGFFLKLSYLFRR